MTDEMRQARINQNLMKKEGTGWDVGYGMLEDSDIEFDHPTNSHAAQPSYSWLAKRQVGSQD
jgi:hypothetical protein